jgi:hypothetical protein
MMEIQKMEMDVAVNALLKQVGHVVVVLLHKKANAINIFQIKLLLLQKGW